MHMKVFHQEIFDEIRLCAFIRRIDKGVTSDLIVMILFEKRVDDPGLASYITKRRELINSMKLVWQRSSV